MSDRFERGITPPKDGWQEHALYLVMVKLNEHNVEHRSVFYAGFLNGKDGGPGNYNAVWNPSNEGEQVTIDDVWHMSVLRKLMDDADWRQPIDVGDQIKEFGV